MKSGRSAVGDFPAIAVVHGVNGLRVSVRGGFDDELAVEMLF